MPRITSFDREPKDQAAQIAWPYTAVMTATLFLNLSFWCEGSLYLWFPGTLPQYAGFIGAVALLIAALFFTGPALAVYASGRTLFSVVESSLGFIPATGARLCCIWFLVVWIAELISWPASRFLSFILRRDVSMVESAVIATALVLFLFVTGLQSVRTNAKLALFTNKLGLAILIAALIRVREGLPTALQGSPASDAHFAVVWRGLSLLAFYVGPLVFLAADFGHSMHDRKQIVMAAGMGIALPLAVTVLLVNLIGAATHASSYYQPSLEPTVAMALWSKAAGSSLPARIIIATVTLFGAVRFGVRALASSVSTDAVGRRLSQVLFGVLMGAIGWCALHPFNAGLTTSLNVVSTCLVVVAGVLTGDLLSGSRVEQVHRIDWVGLGALVAGLATNVWILRTLSDPWWQPGLLPSYGVGFITCLLGRMLQRKFTLVGTPASVPDPRRGV